MQVDDVAAADVINRLRRTEGQVRGIIGMIEQGRDCAEVVTQVAAASRALDRAGFRIISSGLEQCLANDSDGDDHRASVEQMEKLFLSLA